MSVSLIDGHIDDDVLTDEQIIKALEYCVEKGYCTDCPYNESFSDCKVEYDILNLINRQKAEIERLKSILLKFMDEVAKWEEKKGIDVSELPLIPICDEGRDIIDHYRAQAIRQFAERLKKELSFGKYTNAEQIDNLVKEMVGEG
jgi:hypothetical protein